MCHFMSSKTPPAHASIGKRIRWARLQKGYTLDGLAAAMGTTRQTIIRWEKGFYSPNAQSKKKLAAATGQDPSFFASASTPREDDDEESDPVADLYRALDRFIDHKLNIRKALLRSEPEMGGPGVGSG